MLVFRKLENKSGTWHLACLKGLVWMANPPGGLAISVLGFNFNGAPEDEHADAIHSLPNGS